MKAQDAHALIANLARNRSPVEGGNAAVSLTPPSLAAPSKPRPCEVRGVAAAHRADIPPRLAVRFALARAAHLDVNPHDKPERVEQCLIAAWLDEVLTARKWCHIPNERSSARQAARLSEEGVKSGMPDVMIFKRTKGGAPGLALELKAPARKRADNPTAGCSETQLAAALSLMEEGWIWGCVYSAEEAAELVIHEYCIGGEP